MKKVLITLLLVFSIQTAFSQSYRYWMSYEVQAFSNVVKNQRVQFYKKKVNNRSYIKMVNNSCFDVRYSFRIVYAASKRGKGVYAIEKKGIIKKGTSLYFEKYVPNTRYIGFRDYASDYNEYGASKITYFYPAQEDDVWTRDIVVLNCLGFDSPTDYQAKKKATTARLAEEAMERFREEMKLKKMADERKLRQYLDKGLEHHIQHYESKKKEGFYYNVPMDSLEMIANYYGKYMIIVHTGPGYRPGMFELGEEEETFLDNQIVTGLSHVRDRSFYPWAEKKKVKLSYTPAVIIMDPTGRVVYSQSLNTTQLKTGFATWVKGIAQSLPVSEN
jgi:hypothetical protein